MGRAVFQGITFQHKFLNRVWKLIRNSETGYDYLFKNNMLLFPLLLSYCSVIWKFRNRASKCKFFSKRVVKILKKWAPPRQVTFKCPPRPPGLHVMFNEKQQRNTVSTKKDKRIRFLRIRNRSEFPKKCQFYEKQIQIWKPKVSYFQVCHFSCINKYIIYNTILTLLSIFRERICK